jgi:hypothetical protein
MAWVLPPADRQIWRWGLEGIVYDITKGPIISRDRDKQRLEYLCEQY